MTNIYEVKIERCFGVKIARSAALRKCVFNTPSLRSEFYSIVNFENSNEEFSKKLTDFIRNKGLRILDEKPVAHIVDGNYRVDVYFKVTW